MVDPNSGSYNRLSHYVNSSQEARQEEERQEKEAQAKKRKEAAQTERLERARLEAKIIRKILERFVKDPDNLERLSAGHVDGESGASAEISIAGDDFEIFSILIPEEDHDTVDLGQSEDCSSKPPSSLFFLRRKPE